VSAAEKSFLSFSEADLYKNIQIQTFYTIPPLFFRLIKRIICPSDQHIRREIPGGADAGSADADSDAIHDRGKRMNLRTGLGPYQSWSLKSTK